MTTILLIGAGGFLGANVRFGIAAWARRRHGEQLPIGTLIANLAGSFLIGLILGLVDDHELRLFLAVGILGAETTFSTFAVETHALARTGDRAWTLANIAANTIGSVLAAAAGLVLAWLFTSAA